MTAALIVLFTLLLVAAAGARANYVLSRKIGDKLGLERAGLCATIMDGCPMSKYCHKSAPPPLPAVPLTPAPQVSVPQVPVPPAASGFEPDFMAHARAMDARKLRAGSSSSPVKKIEHMMAETDQEARKLRSILVRGG